MGLLGRSQGHAPSPIFVAMTEALDAVTDLSGSPAAIFAHPSALDDVLFRLARTSLEYAAHSVVANLAN